MKYYSTFQARLNELTDKGSIDALAEDVGVTVNAVTQWRCGNNFPSFEKFQRIADYYGVSFDWLAGRSDVREVDAIAQKASKRYGLNEDVLKRMEYIAGELQATNQSNLQCPAHTKLSFIRDMGNILFCSKLGNDLLAIMGEYIMQEYENALPSIIGQGSYMEFFSKDNNMRHLLMIPIQEGLAALRSQWENDNVELVGGMD